MKHLAVFAAIFLFLTTQPALAEGLDDLVLTPGKIAEMENATPPAREEMMHRHRDRLKDLTPEQREELRQKQQSYYESLSPEEKERLKADHEKRRQERLSRMPPEKRKEIEDRREKLQACRDAAPDDEACNRLREDMRKHKPRHRQKPE